MSFLDKFQPREPQTVGVGDTPLNAQYTPDRIASLGPNDIFVFGSNLQGRHAGGAARIAMTPACQNDKVGYCKIQQENQ